MTHSVVDAWLSDSDKHIPLEDTPSLPEQREGTMLALKCAGMDVGQTADTERWGVSELDGLFLPPSPLEDVMVDHDLRTFLGMRRSAVQISGAQFEDDIGRKLRVYNVNRTSTESQTGADLIYINEQRRSAVFVQYKRMNEENGDWIYRPDEQYRKQAKAFASVERIARRLPVTEPDSFRLSNSSCFFKFCRMRTYDIDDRSLCHGSYIANDHLRLHLASPASIGKGGGHRVTQDSCDGGLTNTLFADSVAYGLVGTPPLNFEELGKFSRRSTGATRATVLAVFNDPGGRRPGPARQARRTDGGQSSLF